MHNTALIDFSFDGANKQLARVVVIIVAVFVVYPYRIAAARYTIEPQ